MSRNPRWGPERVGEFSERSGTDRVILGEVRDGLGSILDVRIGSGDHGEVLDGSVDTGGPAERSWTGRWTLGAVRDGLVTLREVRYGSGDNQAGPERVGGPRGGP